MSDWMFGCEFGLRQETCGRYERDRRSRGAHAGFGGCASCVHRTPANEETRIADDRWFIAEIIKEEAYGKKG